MAQQAGHWLEPWEWLSSAHWAGRPHLFRFCIPGAETRQPSSPVTTTAFQVSQCISERSGRHLEESPKCNLNVFLNPLKVIFIHQRHHWASAFVSGSGISPRRLPLLHIVYIQDATGARASCILGCTKSTWQVSLAGPSQFGSRKAAGSTSQRNYQARWLKRSVLTRVQHSANSCFSGEVGDKGDGDTVPVFQGPSHSPRKTI